MSETTAELARLRMALEAITHLSPDFGGGMFHDAYHSPFMTAREIARAALKPSEVHS